VADAEEELGLLRRGEEEMGGGRERRGGEGRLSACATGDRGDGGRPRPMG
jgi:hypothetical protein